LPFKPGLVGGHCIGVDPYYLTFRSEIAGYQPQIVLAGRRINDGMVLNLANEFILEMANRKLLINNSKVLILGLSFKENCPDIRNTKVFEFINYLENFNLNLTVVDPHVDQKEVMNNFKIKVLKKIPKDTKYSGVILAVAHDIFKDYSFMDWQFITKENGIYFDLKNIIPESLKPIRI